MKILSPVSFMAFALLSGIALADPAAQPQKPKGEREGDKQQKEAADKAAAFLRR